MHSTSEQFVRFQRFYRELRHAQTLGRPYPTDRFEFRQLWQQPLTEDDWEYSRQRGQRFQVMGVDIPVGDGHGA